MPDVNPEDLQDALTVVVQEALAKELGQVHGSMLTGFVSMVEFTTGEGERRWSIISPHEQLHVDAVRMASFINAWFQEVQRLNILDALRHISGD